MVIKESQDESHLLENENDEAQAGGPDQVEPPEIAEQPAAAVWKGFVFAVLCAGWFFLRYMRYMISVFVSVVLKHYKNTHPKEDNDDQTLPVNTLDFNSENEKGFIKNTGTNRGISQARNFESTVASGGPNIAHPQDQMEHDQRSEKMKPTRTTQDRGMVISNQSGEPECSRSSSDLDQSSKSLETLDHEEPLMSLGGGQDYQKLEKMKPTRTTHDRGMMIPNQSGEPECSRSSSDLDHSVEELKTLDHEEPLMSLGGGQGLLDSSLTSCQDQALSVDDFIEDNATQTSKEFDTVGLEKDDMPLSDEEKQSDGALDSLVLGDRTMEMPTQSTGHQSIPAGSRNDDTTALKDDKSFSTPSVILQLEDVVSVDDESTKEGNVSSTESKEDSSTEDMDSCEASTEEVLDEAKSVQNEVLGSEKSQSICKLPVSRKHLTLKDENDDPSDEEADGFGQDSQMSETGYFSEMSQDHQDRDTEFSLKVPPPMKDREEDSFKKEEYGMIGGKLKKEVPPDACGVHPSVKLKTATMCQFNQEPLDAGQRGAQPQAEFPHSPLGSEDDEQMRLLLQQLKTLLQEMQETHSQLQLIHRQLQMVIKKAQIPMQCSEHSAQSYWTQMAIQEAPQPFHEPSMHNTSQAIACQMPANVTIGNDKGELGNLHAHEELSCILRECHAMNPKAEERDASKALLWKTEGGRLVTFCTEYL